MNIDEIKDGAFLELYAIGALLPPESRAVETAIARYPELNKEFVSIQKALESYAQVYALQPPASLRDSIMSEISYTNTTNPEITQPKAQKTSANANIPKESKGFNWLPIAILASLGALATFFIKNQSINQLKSEHIVAIDDCDTRTKELEDKVARYEALQSTSNSIIRIDPTEKYPQTKLYFHNNVKTKKNYLQIQKLPLLADNQSFQLWSLKGNSDPIPLDVFNGESELLEVDFVEGTNAYAITIEPLGGQKTPTLENLIGVFSLSGQG